MINYYSKYSKYLKYKNKYLKLKDLYGGNQFHDNYEPQKIEVDNTILNDFFKDIGFTKQDEIIKKYNEIKEDDDKKKLLDNIFSANKDLFCVFIKILNKCTKPEDEEKFNASLNKKNGKTKDGDGKTKDGDTKTKGGKEEKKEEEKKEEEKKEEEGKTEEKPEEKKDNV